MPDSNPLRAGMGVGDGRFLLVRPLARGGMGEVWLARDVRLQEPVALKFLPPEVRENQRALDHLRLEVARSHRLTHPNIVRLHDLHEPDDEPAFIAMEYVDGLSMNALRVEREGKALSWDYLRKPMAQLCAALEYAHAEKIIHRDLKPDNLLIDSRGRLKLTDFGVAVMDSDLARYAATKGGGTLHYMSPQQVEGKHPEISDDIYALGATIYELLTGTAPFQSGDIKEQILRTPPEPIDQRLAAQGIENKIPPEVTAMVMACLSKDPSKRPQNTKAFAERLGLAAEGVPPTRHVIRLEPAKQKPPPAAAEVPAREPVGNDLQWIVGTVALLFLLVGLVWKIHSGPQAIAGLAKHNWPARARWTNSLGMIFVPVPESEALFCIWKTRVQDYQALVNATGHSWRKPSFAQGPTHPAVNISWLDAKEFCTWLTQQERAMGWIGSNQFYRLPSDAEWSLAVGLGHEEGASPKEKDGKNEGIYPWGTDWPPPRGAGNFDQKLNVDDFPYTSPAGSFSTNAYGLYDLAGNAREWCEDLYSPDSRRRVVRGSSWFDSPEIALQSSHRALPPSNRGNNNNRRDIYGFRCVLVTGTTKPAKSAKSPTPP